MEEKLFMKRLRDLRDEKHVPQEEVAKAVGITKSTLSKYELGKNEPGMMIAKRLADYFNVSFDWLVGYSDEKQPIMAKKELANLFSKLLEKDKLEAVRYMEYLYLTSSKEKK